MIEGESRTFGDGSLRVAQAWKLCDTLRGTLPSTTWHYGHPLHVEQLTLRTHALHSQQRPTGVPIFHSPVRWLERRWSGGRSFFVQFALCGRVVLVGYPLFYSSVASINSGNVREVDPWRALHSGPSDAFLDLTLMAVQQGPF